MGTCIVVVEDEATIAQAVAARLRSEGFEVHVAGDGPSGVELCGRVHPDLLILDLMLPGFDGLEVCRRVQSERPTPVIMLTARAEETDLLVGLAVGADDYVTKPFSPRELVARVRALLRRIETLAAVPGPESGAGDIVVGRLRIEPDRRRVILDGEEVGLTPTEFDLLLCLARQPGTPRTRAHLLADVWNQRDGSGARTVDSHVRALRRKLGDHLIRTHHGFGYSLAGES